MFDLSVPKLLVVAVIALVIFGPDQLPKIAAQAGRALRGLRKIADSARNDLREGLGPEFTFEIEDLNPRRLVQKHLLGNVDGDPARRAAAHARQAMANGTLFAPASVTPMTPRRPEPGTPRRDAGMTPGRAAAAGAEFVREAVPEQFARIELACPGADGSRPARAAARFEWICG